MVQSTAGAVQPQPKGRPFQKGHDPRRNPGGRRAPILTQALLDTLTAADAKLIMSKVIAQAKAGELPAIQMLWDRIEGKAVARNEDGTPGDFDLDLSDVDTATLKAAFKRVK